MTFWVGINEPQYWFMMITLFIMIVTLLVGTTYNIIKEVKIQRAIERNPNERPN